MSLILSAGPLVNPVEKEMMIFAFPLGLLPWLLPVRIFCSVSTARRASRAA